jgi:hypothetical protein
MPVDPILPPPAPTDLGVLTQFLDSLSSYSADLVQHLHSGQKLCHYTSVDGAIGILGGDDLWLSHSRYSNDDGEMRHGHELLQAVFAELEAEAATDDIRRTRLDQLRQRVAAVQGEDVYICCFCESDNLLSQWRGYAENGGGVSIEFDPAGFQQFTGPDSAHGLMRLWRVFYDPAQQRKIIRACIDYPYWPSTDEAVCQGFIVDALRFFLPTFKNADFREEQERRLIFSPRADAGPRPRFRQRGGLLLPYYSLRELGPQPPMLPGSGAPPSLMVRHVLIGPGRHKVLNADSMRLLLDCHGRGGVTVQVSSTPYRG